MRGALDECGSFESVLEAAESYKKGEGAEKCIARVLFECVEQQVVLDRVGPCVYIYGLQCVGFEAHLMLTFPGCCG